ncbi:hypothetical protein EYS09_11745 [Streptomyces kasugaensis]|uniref:Uncharacterized protein n=1 Tax=Streptomyces kasugaensis TaxID=1946 RepID=A0A4Q9HWH3_STRKA|nr:hypothetical protein EYS09_11745 [Streptomyces kasugaensis]
MTACGQQHTDPTATGPAPSFGSTSSPLPVRSPLGPARGNVEPDSHDGAPHYRENNGFKIPRDMSPAGEEAAREEAARIEPVLKRLWTAKAWDAESVRAALLKLGYRNEGPDSEQGRGTLFVQAHDRNPGAGVALNVRHDACVTAFVQTTNYQVKVNGRFLETGCFEPRGGH